MIKKALIIGYGSIGKKHFNILNSLKIFDEIKIFSFHLPQSKKVLKTFNSIREFNPNYIVLCNTSNLHFKYLNFLNNNFKNLKIYVEKPLFTQNHKFSVKNKNQIMIGYNLRNHPFIKIISNFINKSNIISCEVRCSSYLPAWRKRNYIKTNTANNKKSGGILYELSHELDYLLMVFKYLSPFYCESLKVSNLKIKGPDYFFGKFKSSKCKNISIYLSYFDF